MPSKICKECWNYKQFKEKCWFYWEGKKECSRFKSSPEEEERYIKEKILEFNL